MQQNQKEVPQVDVLRINDSKIKIMLTKTDVHSFGLDTDTDDYNDTRIKKQVWEILDRVKCEYGFDHTAGKLLIQFYPSRDGGAELFVTLLNSLPKGREISISRSENVTMLDTRRRIYFFQSFRDLLQAARAVSHTKSIAHSELFWSRDEGYFLEIEERGSSRLGQICEFAILSEFAESVPPERYPYIAERSDKLTDGNAVELLSHI